MYSIGRDYTFLEVNIYTNLFEIVFYMLYKLFIQDLVSNLVDSHVSVSTYC